jgi:hypothetical protein
MVSLEIVGFAGFSKIVNSILSDSGAMSIKVTFSFKINRGEGHDS